ncbi:MAG: hypothetical protein ACP5DQ_03410 [Bacteroidales bacterium]
MENMEKRLQKVLIDYGADESKISKDADYYLDLNLDILDLMDLAPKINNEFMIVIKNDEIMKMERISDTIHFLTKKSMFLFSQS